MSLDIRGQRFGRLVAGLPTKERKHGSVVWLCLCDCGTPVMASVKSLRKGDRKSFGCLLRDTWAANGRKMRTHGHTVDFHNSGTFTSWQGMIARCTNPNSTNYHLYGGRTDRPVAIAPEWFDFGTFLRDMGERPKGKTLDRYPNPDGDYEPSNCRWATPIQQGNNRRKHVVAFIGCVVTS